MLVLDIEIRFWHFLTVIYGHLTSLDKQKTIGFFIMISLPGKTLMVVLSPTASSHGFLFIWRTNSLKKNLGHYLGRYLTFCKLKNNWWGRDPNQKNSEFSDLFIYFVRYFGFYNILGRFLG